MEKNIKGTRTEQNLLISFARESQSRNRYNMFAKVAKKEGYEQISAIFQEIANHEYSHAKQFFRQLEDGNLEITTTFPTGQVGTTLENLSTAAELEKEEWTSLYPHFAKIAEDEGLKKIAAIWKLIASVEKAHEERFRKLLDRVEKDEVFKRDYDADWECRVCGYVFHGKEAPKVCPACLHPQAYFEEMKTNY